MGFESLRRLKTTGSLKAQWWWRGPLAVAMLTLAFLFPARMAVAERGTSLDASATEIFDGFSDACPQPIVYRSNLHVSLADHDVDGHEIIVLDPSLKRPAEQFRRIFLAAHECAHHLLGHTTPAGLQRRMHIVGALADQELSADCWAAEFLGRVGRDNEAKRMAEDFYRRGRMSPGNGYPSGVERAMMVRRCWKSGQRQRAAASLSGTKSPDFD